ncbi:WxL domain-containing protein [Lactococcus petauri]|uniref:WxL domain-containing protein n=1 Tax=Lactococcus petauri TaxID=1940789 RepID=UPI000D14F3B5|nr:WxL domain-containing protein [Lactococcus petauri]MCG3097297.1 WxL domain-containing protein [Lactococcus petauri]MDC0811443.1 WxL domain-containing protein [Lactococcus petauri]PST74339.1 cell surface protein [Lactococcus garvieae]
MKKINIGFILLFLLLHAASPAVYALDSDVEAQSSSSAANDKDSSSSLQESELETPTSDTDQTIESENTRDQTSEETAPIEKEAPTTSEAPVQEKSPEDKPQSEKATSVASLSSDASYTDLPGAHEPDRNGLYLLFPLRTGILSQPQEEQYIVEGTTADLSIKTTSWVTSLGKVKVKVNAWQEQDDGSWLNMGSIGEFSDRSGILGSTKQSINIPVTNLQAGNYYFQLETRLNTLPIIGSISAMTYYSQLAKVTVKDKPVAASGISITTPNVVFEKATYSAKAVTTPRDATGKITWNSSLKGINFLKTEGRSVEFDAGDQLDEVNTDVQAPGIPFTISAGIRNDDGTTPTDNKTIYLGGLAAKNVAEDSGMSWELDGQGLADLNKSVESAEVWSYEWKYIEGKTSKAFSETQGVKNYKGTVSDLTSLNDTDHILSFAQDSAFMKTAREATENGKPFAVQVTFSTTIDTGDGKKETVTLSSNKAQLLVNKATGKLLLQQVPNFDFGKLPASYIYDGTKDREPTAQDHLEIVDSRAKGGWRLSAKMSRFQSNNNHRLKFNSQLTMSTYPFEINLKDDDIDNYIVDSVSSEAFDLTGQLLLQPDPLADLSAGETFSSTITWNLVSTTKSTPPA